MEGGGWPEVTQLGGRRALIYDVADPTPHILLGEAHDSAQPISTFLPFGHTDWLRPGHMIQSSPVRDLPGGFAE